MLDDFLDSRGEAFSDLVLPGIPKHSKGTMPFSPSESRQRAQPSSCTARTCKISPGVMKSSSGRVGINVDVTARYVGEEAGRACAASKAGVPMVAGKPRGEPAAPAP